jgi:hypothetical protein
LDKRKTRRGGRFGCKTLAPAAAKCVMNWWNYRRSSETEFPSPEAVESVAGVVR